MTHRTNTTSSSSTRRRVGRRRWKHAVVAPLLVLQVLPGGRRGNFGGVVHLASALSLAGNRYETTTDVESEANIALDAADMRESDNKADKKDIYLNGRNSQYQNEAGVSVNRSLSSLSLSSVNTMNQDYMYNLFRYTFQKIGEEEEGEPDGEFDDLPVEQYADTIVLDLFDLNKPHIETEAALIMNVWMKIVNELYHAMRKCRDRTASADGNDSGLSNLDTAMAYWIGVGQELGDSESGNLLYNLAEKAGERFGQDGSGTNDSGETLVNQKIIDYVNKIKSEIIDTGRCIEGAYVEYRTLVHKIIGQMTVPLIQQLIYHLMQPGAGDSSFIELYTLSFLPRIEACDRETYKVFLNTLVLQDFDGDSETFITDNLQPMYSCLGITCEDVGAYAFDVVPQCDDDANALADIAGYTPDTDVREHLKIDRDIRNMRILMQMEAFDAATDVYLNGQNSLKGTEYRSLHGLATSPNLGEVGTQFTVFSSYYGTETYADETITKALTREFPFAGGTSVEQRTEVVMRTLQCQVMYMYTLREMFDTVHDCRDNNQQGNVDMVKAWDEAAAFLVGSLEGTDRGGDTGGVLMYALAKEMCDSFGTCQNGEAQVTEEVVDILIAGKDLLGGPNPNCDGVETLVLDQISPLLVVPLMQATLLSAELNEPLAVGSNDKKLASGHAFAFSVLPLVAAVNVTSADTIRSNMEFDLGKKPVADGAEAVFDAFKFAISAPLGVRCADVGVYDDAAEYGDMCDLPVDTGGGGGTGGGGTGGGGGGGNNNTGTNGTDTGGGGTNGTDTGGGGGGGEGPPENFELGFGRYEFTSDVDAHIAIALDVKDMKTAGTRDEAKTVYNDGKNAIDGGTTITLAGFSLNAGTTMKQNPTYNVYRYAFKDEPVFIETPQGGTLPDSAYANTVVNKAFTVAEDQELASEAAVVMNVWMHITQSLYDAIKECEGGGGTSSVDEAFAYWVGDEQSEGNDDGYLMYAMTERAAGRFGQDQAEGESPINTAIIDLLNEAKTLTDGCNANPSNFVQLRRVVHQIISKMTVPLMQNLIYHMKEGRSENYIELYALSVVPQVAGCDPAVYRYLKDNLIDQDYKKEDEEEVTGKLESMFSCLGITCEDIGYAGCGEFVLNPLAGYVPASDVSEEAHIDRDVLNMNILMTMSAYDAAHDLYKYGRYSNLDSTTYRSLRNIAISLDRNDVPQYQTFKSYYDDNDTYVNDLIENAIQGSNSNGNSDEQRTELVVRSLQCMVLYMEPLSRMYGAVQECNAKAPLGEVGGVERWDEAAAFLIGSIEGTERGGSINKDEGGGGGDGLLMYGLAKEFCNDFDTCEGSGDASVNEKLLEYLTGGKSFLVDKDCQGTADLIGIGILPILQVPLIQGTLQFATVNEDVDVTVSTEGSLAAGFALASSILPLVDAADTGSADSIKTNIEFGAGTAARPSDYTAVVIFDAFRKAAPNMDLDCADIGNHRDLVDEIPNEGSICVKNITKPTTSTTLAEGLYTTTTYVQDRANIALDIRDMETAELGKNMNLAKLLYFDGLHSDIYNDKGIKTGLRSLSEFSTAAAATMANEPVYNIFLYALRDSNGKYLGQDVSRYADSLVREIFDNPNVASGQTLASEAAVALNLWMYVVHELYSTVDNCKKKVLADSDGVHSIDEAVAYWIGDSQQTGNSLKGHLLYALAEQMGERFGQDENGQSRSNRNILRLMNQAKLELTFPDACTENVSTHGRLRAIVIKIVSQMSVPLLQALIYNLAKNDRDRVRVYAHSIIPLTAGCSPSTYTYLRDKLMEPNYKVSETSDIIKKLQSTYDCLGLECKDVGTIDGEEVTVCIDVEERNPLAGYTPSSDVRQYAKLDLDIHHIRIFAEMNAIPAIEDYYQMGKHVIVPTAGGGGESGDEMLSLHEIATSSERRAYPGFETFARYFEDDENYADKLLTTVLASLESNQAGTTPAAYPLASVVQLRKMVVLTLQFMVSNMFALQTMYEAISDCEAAAATARSSSNVGNYDTAAETWDTAAALLIGSLEGTKSGGSDDGLMIHGLAKDRCVQFGRCVAGGKALVNEELILRLYSGRGEVSVGNCAALKKTVKVIEPLMTVPLIQSTLKEAIEGSKLGFFSTSEDLAEMYIYSRSVLPYVHEANQAAALIINKNMDFQFTTEPVPDGPAAVFKAFEDAIPKMNGVDCTLVGGMDGMDVCPATADESSGWSRLGDGIFFSSSLVVGSLVLVGILFL